MNEPAGQGRTRTEESKVDSVDFRHLAAFQRVYQERAYAVAGEGVLATRKSMVRMIRNLERSFECALFTESSSGKLVPSPFAERLFNDLRFLNTAKQRLTDHIAAIRENGRILHVGSSAAVFRTLEFRTLFRELQALDGIRTCYTPVDSAHAGKALVSGHCDLFVGCWSGTGSRFVTHDAGEVTYRLYRRGAEVLRPAVAPGAVVVSLYNQVPELPPVPDGHRAWEVIDDSQWLYWLDHAEECPAGTVVLGPEVELEPEWWHVVESQPDIPVSRKLHVGFLRQHPYEFLLALAQRIENRTLGS